MLKIPTYKPIKKGGDTDCPDCSTPSGGVGVNTISLSTMITTLKQNLSLNSDQLAWINDPANSQEVTEIYQYLQKHRDLNGNYNEEAKDIASEIIDALKLEIPVIFDLTEENIYQNEPLDYTKLTSEQRIAVVIHAIKKANEDDTVSFFYINDQFYNFPPVAVRLVAKVPINGKLLDIMIDFGVYRNLQIKEFPNNTYQALLNGSIGNYSISGYWSVMQYRTYGAKFPNGGDAILIAVKQKSELNHDNSDILENYLGYY